MRVKFRYNIDYLLETSDIKPPSLSLFHRGLKIFIGKSLMLRSSCTFCSALLYEIKGNIKKSRKVENSFVMSRHNQFSFWCQKLRVLILHRIFQTEVTGLHFSFDLDLNRWICLNLFDYLLGRLTYYRSFVDLRAHSYRRLWRLARTSFPSNIVKCELFFTRSTWNFDFFLLTWVNHAFDSFQNTWTEAKNLGFLWLCSNFFLLLRYRLELGWQRSYLWVLMSSLRWVSDWILGKNWRVYRILNS